MARTPRMPTLWEVPDDLWARMQGLLERYDPPRATGRPRAEARRIMDAIIFRLRTGCQWNHIPKVYGDDATIHRTFQRWCERGLFERLWALLVEECAELGAIDWRWQAVDTSMGKAAAGARPRGRTPRIGPRPARNALC